MNLMIALCMLQSEKNGLREVNMWKELFDNILGEREFTAPVAKAGLQEAEAEMGHELPDDLKRLLLETDGVKDAYRCDLIWSLNRIKKDNLLFRKSDDFKELYMPFDCLLFFSDAGNGDQFAYSVLNGKISKEDIYVWNHEDDSRTWVAPSLKVFCEWWSNGTIKI